MPNDNSNESNFPPQNPSNTHGFDGNSHGPSDESADAASDAFADAGEHSNPMLSRMLELETELEESKARSLRLMADFNNYQRRAMQNEIAAEQQGAAAVASAVVAIVDHFDNALALDPSKSSAEQVIAGVKVIREELLKALAKYGVRLIAPKRGDPFVPGRHEALMQQSADDVETGNIVQVFQVGFALVTQSGERVLRPAKVVVAP